MRRDFFVPDTRSFDKGEYYRLEGIKEATEFITQYQQEIERCRQGVSAARARSPLPKKPRTLWEFISGKAAEPDEVELARRHKEQRLRNTVADLEQWKHRLTPPPQFLPDAFDSLPSLYEAMRQVEDSIETVKELQSPTTDTVVEDYLKPLGFAGCRGSQWWSLNVKLRLKLESELHALKKRKRELCTHILQEAAVFTVPQLQDLIATFQHQLSIDIARHGDNGQFQSEYRCPDCVVTRRFIEQLQQLLPPSQEVPVRISAARQGFTTYRLLATSDAGVPVSYMEQLFSSWAASKPPQVEFALVATPNEIYPLIHLPTTAADTFEQLLDSYFPGTVLEPQQWEEFPEHCTAHNRYRLNLVYSPIRTFTAFNPDPYTNFCAAMGTTLRPGETAVLSIRFVPPKLALPEHWLEPLDPVQQKKKGTPQWFVSIETFITIPRGASTSARAEQIRDTIERSFLRQYQPPVQHPSVEPRLILWTAESARTMYAEDPAAEELFALDPELLHATLLSHEELVGLVHLPHKSVTHPLLKRANMQERKAPDSLLEPNGLLLGINYYRRKQYPVYLPHAMRSRHLYVVGASGSGKSVFLTNLIKQDLENGFGCAVVDPHGDLVEELLRLVPEHRLNDVVYLNPADREWPVALNPLQATEEEQDLVMANFMTLFQRMFVSGDAPRLLNILRFTVTTLLEAGGKNFLDIHKFLTMPDFKRSVLAQISNPMLLQFWEEQFPLLPKGATDPITNKFSQFLLTSIVRNMLSQSDSRINFYQIMQQKKILLCNLSQGKIQEENSQLLGSILVSQLQQAAMQRAHVKPEQRPLFTLYIDEFQNYTTGDETAFLKILSEARKYNVGLALAHQYTSQIPQQLFAAIEGNVYTQASFRVSTSDAQYLQKSFSGYEAKDLLNLTIGQAVMRVGAATNSFTVQTPPPPEPPASDHSTSIIAESRRKFATPRAEVEALLRPRRPQEPEPGSNAPPSATAEPSVQQPDTLSTPAPSATTPKPKSVFDEFWDKQ